MNHQGQRLKLFWIFLCLQTLASICSAEVLHWPKLCANQIVTVKNTSQQTGDILLQTWNHSLVTEMDYVLPAQGQVDISLTNDLADPDQDYSLLSYEMAGTFSVATTCSTFSAQANSIEGGEIYFHVNPQDTNQVYLKNLFAGTNVFLIEEVNLLGISVAAAQVATVDFRQSKTVAIKTHPETYYLKVSSLNRFSSFVLTEHSVISPSLTKPQPSLASPLGVYFLMGPMSGDGDQFIVNITDTNLIAQARAEITNPAKILAAQVILGHQGFNRNLASVEKSFWSWSTTTVTGFQKFGSAICNGSPQTVEDQIEKWAQAPGSICFWGYRVKKELTTAEIMKP